MKNNSFYLLIFISLISFFHTSCASFKPPEFRSIENFEVTSINPTAKYKLDVKMFNPNPVGAKVKEINVKVRVFNNDMNVNSRGKFKIPSGTEFILPLEGETTIENATNALKQGFMSLFGGSPLIPVEIEGYVVVKKFIVRKKIPFSFKENYDLNNIRMPSKR